MKTTNAARRAAVAALGFHVFVSAGMVSAAVAANPAAKPFPLMVGDPAPPLVPSRWIRGKPVLVFAPGRAYVVDFWASWCGPCVADLPHLNALQRRYSKDATFVWMNVWEPRPSELDRFLSGLKEEVGFAVALDKVTVPPGKEMSEAMYDGGTAATVKW
ncbi:MAG TPA: TlpA family protein disulfide reductase [Thermoanaerobaculia bacterium]|nr:TlpA family protein disulfide reductase [Thermoanaerobaculia bacterium]